MALFENKKSVVPAYTTALLVLLLLLLLLLPALAIEFKNLEGKNLGKVHSFLYSLLFFLLPLGLFYRNIKLYLYLQLLWILLSPFFLFSILLFDVKPDADLIQLVLQTNRGEVAELSSGWVGIFVVVTLVYGALYLLAVKSLPIRQLHRRTAAGILAISVALLAGEFIIDTDVFRENRGTWFESYYPTSFMYDLYKTYDYAEKNNIAQATSFSFHAYRKDTAAQRQIYVLIIGESARYDKWRINGYVRDTSPRLNRRPHLLVYPAAVAGGTLTYISVPQMITRANPENLAAQYKEKSILSAFKDAGFKTAWLSNQSGHGIFTNGTITDHAKTADYSIFNLYEPENKEYDPFDGRLLPELDSFIANTKGNLFIVLHTIGSHWDYTKRYPKSFDCFQPSGYEQSIYPTTEKNLQAFLNTYDNTIRYSDFVIDSTIGIVQKYGTISGVLYVSDHGENLTETNVLKTKSRRVPDEGTLHVPFFVWTSEAYQKQFPEKQKNLEAHTQNKIGTENTFYTLLDMADISFPGFDSTKSIAAACFKDDPQNYYVLKANKAFAYASLHENRRP